MLKKSESLKITLNRQIQLFIAIFVVLLIIVVTSILFITEAIEKRLDWNVDIVGVLFFGGMALLVIAIYIFVRIFHKAYLYVDNEKIVKKTNNKVEFEIRWDEIDEIVYTNIKWYQIFIYFFHSFDLAIKKKKVIKKKPWHDDFQYFASMSKKDAQKIKEMFFPELKII